MFTRTSDWKFGYVLGALTGDGCTYMFRSSFYKTPRRIVTIVAQDREMVEGVAEFCAELFNCSAKLRGPITQLKMFNHPYYDWATTRKSVVETLTKNSKFILPFNKEKWRGYVGGFFDAEGHHSLSSFVAGSQKGKVPLMRSIQRVIESYGITTNFHVDKQSTTLLRVIGYPRSQKGIPMQQRSSRAREMRGRFLEVFQPLIKRKYSRFLETPVEAAS